MITMTFALLQAVARTWGDAVFLAPGWTGLAIPFFVLIGCSFWLLCSTGPRRAEAGVSRRAATPRPRRAADRVSSATRLADAAHAAQSVAPAPPAAAAESVNCAADAAGAEAPESLESEASLDPVSVKSKPDGVNGRCRMDLAATRSGLELTVELPGLREEEVEVHVVDDLLTIRGRKQFEPDREEKNYRLVERDYGAFSRSIELPEGVPSDKIKASLSRGVLTVTIPNPAKLEPKRVKVQADPVELAETRDGFELSVPVPGLAESEIEVAVNRGVLTVNGSSEVPPEGSADVTEVRPGAFTRSIELPAGVNAERISATLSKGVLRVFIPGPADDHHHRIAVNVAA